MLLATEFHSFPTLKWLNRRVNVSDIPQTETGHLVPKPFRPRTFRPQVWLTRPQMQFTINVNSINVFVEMIVKG